MLKDYLICLIIATVPVNAQLFGLFGFGNISGGILSGINATIGVGINSGFLSRSGRLHNNVLQSASNLLSTQNLPEDLQTRVADTLAKAEESFKGCNQLMLWQYRQCTSSELKKAMTAIKAIEDEAKKRLSDATVSPSTAAPVEIVTESSVLE